MNLTQKYRESNFKGFTYAFKELQCTKFDIDDAANQKRLSDAKLMQIEYRKTIEDIV